MKILTKLQGKNHFYALSSKKRFLITKNRKLLTLFGSTCLVLILVALPFTSACAQPAPKPKPITLKLVTFLSANNPSMVSFKKSFIDKVNQQAKGQLTIKFLGGPEVVAVPDQGSAVKNGVIDMSLALVGTYESLVPGAGAIGLSSISYELERERGFLDLMNDIHKKTNLFALGRGVAIWGPYFYIFLNKLVKKPEDLAGVTIGSNPIFKTFVEGTGASSTIVQLPEYYTAMERGLSDGILTAYHAWTGFGVHEVTKYVLEHPFMSPNSLIIINLDTWNSIPEHLQKLLLDVGFESDRDMANAETAIRRGARQKGLNAGVKLIKFSPADAERFTESGYNASWKKRMKRYPEVTAKFKKIFTP